MKKPILLTSLFFFCIFAFGQTIQLYKENPHYFQYKEKPILLITSGEHYGAVINLDFDYVKYLNTLQSEGLNLTRLFTGIYVEEPNGFGIQNNTLTPKTGKMLIPYMRGFEEGYPLGGNKFDLMVWDGTYFNRLRNFITEAQKRDIIVEVVLFSSCYGAYNLHPYNSVNNINSTTPIEAKDLHTLNNGNVLQFQEKFVRKFVKELNPFDNVYFEIQNEPYADNAVRTHTIHSYISADEMKDKGQFWKNAVEVASSENLSWQKKMAEIIKDEELKINKKKHLIAQNYSNFRYPLESIDRNVSVLNFHYALPEAVAWNYHFNKPISFDESGFAGKEDATYRKQAWNFILSGGSVINFLDYSFVTGKEDGTENQNVAPGGGSTALRASLKTLKNFMEGFTLAKLIPDYTSIASSPGSIHKCMSNQSTEFAIYLEGGKTAEVNISLAVGKYSLEWINTQNANIEKSETIDHPGKVAKVVGPAYQEDIALRIKKVL